MKLTEFHTFSCIGALAVLFGIFLFIGGGILAGSSTSLVIGAIDIGFGMLILLQLARGIDRN